MDFSRTNEGKGTFRIAHAMAICATLAFLSAPIFFWRRLVFLSAAVLRYNFRPGHPGRHGMI